MGKIFSQPACGWSKFNFKDSAVISYIDNFPYNLLTEIIESIKDIRPFVITFDAEGYDYTLLSTDKITMEYILRKEGLSIEELPFSFGNFIDDVCEDVEKYMDILSTFPASLEFSEDVNKEKYKERLENMVKEIRGISKELYRYDSKKEERKTVIK